MKKKELLKRIEALEALACVEKKTELEVGKWYILKGNGVVNYQGGSSGYVLEAEGSWYNNSYWCFYGCQREATPQEVEKALIKEAKRRGYKTGCMVKSFVSGITPIEYSEIHYRFDSNTLVMGGAWIFKDGKWAEVIKNADKFAELKEAHKNGAVIQVYYRLPYNDSMSWNDVTNEDDHVLWNEYLEHRIKPDDKPKVGDVCKFWDKDESEFIIDVLNSTDCTSHPYNTRNGLSSINAKKLTESEVISLLFNNNGAN